MKSLANRKISFGSVFFFSLPTIINMIFMSLYTIVDGALVARLVSTDAMSAVNIVYPLLSVVVAVGTMFGSGGTAIIARKLGEGKKREACEKLTFLVVCAVSLGALISLLIFLFLRPLLFLLGASETIYGYCHAYTLPLLFFLPASILQLMFQTLFVAEGKPNLGLFVTVLAGLTNMVLDYVFMALLGTGIAGAAVATGLGYCLPALTGLIYFASNRRGNLFFVRFKPDWPLLLKSISNGSSEMVTNLSVSVTTLLFNLIMMHFLGADGVAAISIVLYLDFMLIAISLGYAMGISPLISYHYGAGNHESLQKLHRISLRFILLFSCGITAATILFSRPLVSIFTDTGSPVFSFAVEGIVLYAAGYLVKGYNIYSSAMFTAFSNGHISALLSFGRTFGLLVLCTLLLTALMGVRGIWLATPVAELISFFICRHFVVKYRSVYHYAPAASAAANGRPKGV